MERDIAWKKYDEAAHEALEALANSFDFAAVSG